MLFRSVMVHRMNIRFAMPGIVIAVSACGGGQPPATAAADTARPTATAPLDSLSNIQRARAVLGWGTTDTVRVTGYEVDPAGVLIDLAQACGNAPGCQGRVGSVLIRADGRASRVLRYRQTGQHLAATPNDR